MSGHDHDDETTGAHGDWDSRYATPEDGSEQLWSGLVNEALVAEVADLPPGRALDVGCGEGADAVWLAGRGWQVTGLDPSRVALGRAERAAAATGSEITWMQATLERAELPRGEFDLVVAMYAALERSSCPAELLASLVAPGGQLLVVHHAEVDRQRALAHGFDPDAYLKPTDVPPALAGRPGEVWEIVTDEPRERHVTAGAGAHHTADLVVRAHRLR